MSNISAKVTEIQDVYIKNSNRAQKGKILLYDFVFLMFAIIGGLIFFAVDYLVSILGGDLWTVLFVLVVACVFVFSYRVFKKIPFINKRNYYLYCLLYCLGSIILTWLVFLILNIVDVFSGNEYFFMFITVKSWTLFPLCFSLMALGLIAISISCFKTCKRCARSGFGIASKNNYIVEKITKEHVDSVRCEKPNVETGELEPYYKTYYKNYEYRFYRHYCSVCGYIIYEKMRKVKCRKKYLSDIETFTDAEKALNEKRIADSKEIMQKKESKTMDKLYAMFNDTITPIETSVENPTEKKE